MPFAYDWQSHTSTSPNAAWRAKLVSLVERKLELHKRSPRLPQEQEMVKRVLGKAPRMQDRSTDGDDIWVE